MFKDGFHKSRGEMIVIGVGCNRSGLGQGPGMREMMINTKTWLHSKKMGDQCTQAKDILSIALQVFYSRGNTWDSS